MPARMTIGGRIAQARRELAVRLRRDLTQGDVAELAGTTPATMSRWESDTAVPKEDALAVLAKVLGVTPAYLRYGVGDIPKSVTVIEATQTIEPVRTRRGKRDVG